MGTIIGIDYGERRVGVAVSDETATLAVPSETISVTDRPSLLAAIENAVKEKRAEKVVVGLPLSLSGVVTDQTRETQTFIRELTEHLAIPVDVQDERLTTVEAERGGSDKATKDSRAAALMLQSYLDKQKEPQR